MHRKTREMHTFVDLFGLSQDLFKTRTIENHRQIIEIIMNNGNCLKFIKYTCQYKYKYQCNSASTIMPNHVQILLESCPNHAGVMLEKCWNHAHIISESLPKSFPNHSRIMDKSCPKLSYLLLTIDEVTLCRLPPPSARIPYEIRVQNIRKCSLARFLVLHIFYQIIQM